MNKNAIQKYAIWARNELIEQVKQRAYQYGISEKGYGDENAAVIAGRVLSPDEKRQRRSFVNEIKKSGYKQAVEEVAYTWFNRFVALRYMEVNDFLPTHIRVFSDTNGNFKPEILTSVLHLDLPGLDKAKVSALLNANATEELYRYLLLTQCNALNSLLPEMFERMGAYTEMLLPNNILKPESVIGRLVKDIPEEDFRDAVQIIGWLYQYYNTEPNAKVTGRPNGKKISKEEIPAATQRFTPDWIVRYMVENSIGRLWLEGHSDDELKAKWNYYLDEAEQEADVKERLAKIRELYKTIKPEELKVLDCCMGSGHILVYAFDVLMQIYEIYGYSQRDAVKSIIENNLYGLDIDKRAAQLAYFAVMMKALEYDKRFLRRDKIPQPHVYAICESNYLDPYCIEYFVNGNSKMKVEIETLITELYDAKEYGSLLKVSNVDFNSMIARFDEIRNDINMYREAALNELLPFVQVAKVMAQKYEVVITNPPYMLINNGDDKLSTYVKENYDASKTDLYAAFIEKCNYFTRKNYFYALVTMHSWMFTSSFESFRGTLQQYTINSLVHLGKRAFEEIKGEVVQTVTFVMRNVSVYNYNGTYVRLVKPTTQDEKEQLFLSGSCRYIASYKNYSKIIGKPIAYWISEGMCAAFSKSHLSDFAHCCTGMQTGDNDKYIRLWAEVNINDTTIINPEAKYKKYNCGGESRKWYGNHNNLVLWGDSGTQIRNEKSSVIRNEKYFFKKGISWKRIGSSVFYLRYLPEGFIFDQAGDSMFMMDNKWLYYVLAFVNSKVAVAAFEFIAPTLNLTAGNMNKLPLIYEPFADIDKMVEENISIAKADWDSFETSWDFDKNPLISADKYKTISTAFGKWEILCNERIKRVKANEERNNEYFIQLYGLDEELSPNLNDTDITIRKADLQRDIKSLISYAVGCMFGRYSLDVNGLVYAGGAWDVSKYKTFPADTDNILPICDDDYFDDDIAGRFVAFVKTAYGADTLDENLKFIADALGGKGTPREVIRNYFLNDFFKDHCKIYQKRPIYWLFDSGKKNGFKALIYIHRYSRDLLAKLRTDYVHEQQERYRTQLSHIAGALNTATGAERARLLKQQDKLSAQAREIGAYEEKVHHLADQNIMIDLDDGVKKNYEIFADVLAKLG